MHYDTLNRHGDALYSPSTVAERFWSKVDTSGDCWPWTGAHLGGYGQIHVERSTRLATHVAWELATGEPVPAGCDVLHTCDYPPCVRNDEVGTYDVAGVSHVRRGHLFLGDAQVNGRDMASKGRNAGGTLPGELHGRVKLSEVKVAEIRVRHAHGESQAALARAYGVRAQSIAAIVHNQTWRGGGR